MEHTTETHVPERPRLELLRSFGCLLYAYTGGSNKLKPQAEIGAYLGPCVDRKGVLYFSPKQNKVLSTCNYKCDEHTYPWREAANAGSLRKAIECFTKTAEDKNLLFGEPENKDTEEGDNSKDEDKAPINKSQTRAHGSGGPPIDL